MKVAILLFAALVAVFCEEEVDLSHGFGTDIDWVSWDNALDLAKEQNKPVFLLIHKTWCGACKALKKNFKGSNKRNELVELSKKFVMVNLEDDEEPDDIRYQIDGAYIPRLFFLDKNGDPMAVDNKKNYPNNAYYFPQAVDVLKAMKLALKEFGGDDESKKDTVKDDKEEKEGVAEKKEKKEDKKTESAENKENKKKEDKKEKKTEKKDKNEKKEKKDDKKEEKAEKKDKKENKDKKEEKKDKSEKTDKKAKKEKSEKQEKSEKKEEKKQKDAKKDTKTKDSKKEEKKEKKSDDGKKSKKDAGKKKTEL